MSLKNFDRPVPLQWKGDASRALEIRAVRSGGEYDVRKRHLYEYNDNSCAPSPEEHYEPAGFLDILKMDPFDGLLILDPTYFCDLRCSFCSLPIDNKTMINWDRLREYYRKLALSGMRHAVITGGEPGIMPGFLNMVEDLRQMGFSDVNIFTHGKWARNKDYLQAAIDAGITGITMSIKSFSNEISELITTKKNVYNHQIEAISNIGEKIASGALGRLHINHVITKDSLLQLAELDWLEFIPPGAVMDFCIVEPYEDTMVELVPSGNDVAEILPKIFEACKRKGVGYKIDGVPQCLLGDYAASSGDPKNVLDLNLRVFVKPGPTSDLMLAHYGYQRILQYGYRDPCKTCDMKNKCAGLHKKFDDSWAIRAQNANP